MANSKAFAGKVAFVTGSSRGIGRVIATHFANLGTSVAIQGTTPTSARAFGEADSLEAVAKAGTDDASAAMKTMREAPIHDVFTANGTVRADGRVLYDRYLMKVKTPAESKTPWDYLTVVDKIPAADAFRPRARAAAR